MMLFEQKPTIFLKNLEKYNFGIVFALVYLGNFRTIKCLELVLNLVQFFKNKTKINFYEQTKNVVGFRFSYSCIAN